MRAEGTGKQRLALVSWRVVFARFDDDESGEFDVPPPTADAENGFASPRLSSLFAGSPVGLGGSPSRGPNRNAYVSKPGMLKCFCAYKNMFYSFLLHTYQEHLIYCFGTYAHTHNKNKIHMLLYHVFVLLGKEHKNS